MKQSTGQRLIIAGLLITASFSAYAAHTLKELKSNIAIVIQPKIQVQTATSEVLQSSTGILVTIQTIKITGESDEDWMARHAASVIVARDS